MSVVVVTAVTASIAISISALLMPMSVHSIFVQAAMTFLVGNGMYSGAFDLSIMAFLQTM